MNSDDWLVGYWVESLVNWKGEKSGLRLVGYSDLPMVETLGMYWARMMVELMVVK
jgi:hypothetical protein